METKYKRSKTPGLIFQWGLGIPWDGRKYHLSFLSPQYVIENFEDEPSTDIVKVSCKLPGLVQYSDSDELSILRFQGGLLSQYEFQVLKFYQRSNLGQQLRNQVYGYVNFFFLINVRFLSYIIILLSVFRFFGVIRKGKPFL